MRYASLVLIGVVAFGQNGSPTFEVASVKPSAPSNSRPYGGGGPGTADPEHARYFGTPLMPIPRTVGFPVQAGSTERSTTLR